MKIIFQDRALADLDRIYDWIARDSPANAASVIERILDSIDNTLALFPLMGRAGAVAGTREWAVPALSCRV